MTFQQLFARPAPISSGHRQGIPSTRSIYTAAVLLCSHWCYLRWWLGTPIQPLGRLHDGSLSDWQLMLRGGQFICCVVLACRVHCRHASVRRSVQAMPLCATCCMCCCGAGAPQPCLCKAQHVCFQVSVQPPEEVLCASQVQQRAALQRHINISH